MNWARHQRNKKKKKKKNELQFMISEMSLVKDMYVKKNNY